MGQGTDDEILVLFWILQGLLITQRSSNILFSLKAERMLEQLLLLHGHAQGCFGWKSQWGNELLSGGLCSESDF